MTNSELSSTLNAAEEFVKEYMSKYDPSHDWFHVDRVRRQALKIAKEEIKRRPVDLEIVEYAALFHDIGDAKYIIAGSKTARETVLEFFKEHQFDSAKAELITNIIENVSYRKELAAVPDPWRDNCIELHIVQDADKLDAMGAFGILRCAAFSGAKGRALYNPEEKPIENMTKEQYDAQSKAGHGTAISHFHEKLFHLKDRIKTETGKIMATSRHNYMIEFVQTIEKEYSMDI
ncbi:uncharacterized protein VTP21DRAFT_1514 [Calcarisporiella thermophila]|uniref:uncharacterized protein n=1 Tax=Calcarisporiella thermophila TaxID=911321 RepID=UPI003744650F